MRISLFGKSEAIEADIDNFLNHLSEAGILFEQTIKHYMKGGASENFQEEVSRLDKMEANADELAKRIGRSLYTEMLIPDLRADVLSLIQDLNFLVGVYSNIATNFDIERPEHAQASAEAHEMYGELVENTVKSVEMTVVSARAFFRDIGAVNDHVHKVGHYEAEADVISQKLKRHIFAQEFSLDIKMQYRYFIDVLEELADEAKDASEWIAIYAIKRTL
jgi:predicted phosphate transport protein (TIGR00153 family)